MRYNKILVAVDDSAASLRAAKAGFELAADLKSEVAIIYVIDRSKEIGNIDAGIMPEDVAAHLKQRAEDTISEVIKLYSGSLGVQRFIPEGTPQEEIIGAIHNWKADLLIMGTHGRTGLKHLLMGSVAEHIIRHSPIPVLVVPMNKE